MNRQQDMFRLRKWFLKKQRDLSSTNAMLLYSLTQSLVLHAHTTRLFRHQEKFFPAASTATRFISRRDSSVQHAMWKRADRLQLFLQLLSTQVAAWMKLYSRNSKAPATAKLTLTASSRSAVCSLQSTSRRAAHARKSCFLPIRSSRNCGFSAKS